ncbi:Homeobox domain protein [Paragonimus heterotremus]|uniref:Homeobox domain protein n=1 Tax=Paragonimus heterotremus TaxID=100268 RepID=A0A8J4TRP4_9TREM|nr:Homeobox domain protein [Paragonimus heterotremus]
MINPKPDLHSPCFSEPSLLIPGLLDFKHPGVLDPVAELTVRCQFCVCEVPSSKLLVHMAMHFMQLSKTLSSKEAIPEGERLGELEESAAQAISEPKWSLHLTAENFYIMFCRQPDMRFRLVNEITKVIQSTLAKSPLSVTVCDNEIILLLAIELLAQEQQIQLRVNQTVTFYQYVNKHWFLLNRIKCEQGRQMQTCLQCSKRFLLSTTQELHTRLFHSVSQNGYTKQMQPRELIELFYEVVSALDGTRPSVRTSELQQHPITEEITPPSDTDFWECLSKPCDPIANFPLPCNKSPKNLYSVGMSGVESSDFIASPLDRLMQASFAKVPISNCTATSVVSPSPIPTDLSFSSFGSYVMTTTRSNQQVAQPSNLSYKTDRLQVLERKLSNKSLEPLEFGESGARSKAYSSLPLRRSRTRLSETQLTVLRSYFDINNSPSEEKLNEICGKTGLQSKVVKHWFRNTLFKERQRNKDNPYNFSIPPSTSLNLEEYEKTGRVEVRPAFMDTYNRDSPTRPPDSIGLNYEQQLTDSNPRLSNQLDGINSTTGMPVPTISEAGSEGFSLRNSDTDSSSITGFPLTPPAKRPSQNLSSETPESLAVVNKRLCMQSKDVTNTLRGLYVATDFPDTKRDEYTPTSNLLTLAESTPPRTSPSNPRFTGSLGVPVISDLAGSLSNNSTRFPQPLEALVLTALNQRINPPPAELIECDTPLDLSTTGSQPVKFNTTLYPFSFGNSPNLRINTNPSISSSLVSSPSPSTLTIETNKPHQSILPSTTSSMAGVRRNRTSITVLQSRCMHSLYAHHKTPSVHECDRLGAMIGLTRRVVQVWFQNQRAKEKKMARVSSAYLNTPVSVLPSDMADFSQIDPTFCHMCCVPIRSEVGDSLLSVGQTLGSEFPKSTGSYTGNTLGTNALTSHASFVDHLFSSTHLRNLVSWCTVEANNGHV